MLAYHQGIILKKYNENNKFMSAVSELKISKRTINFKIGIIKFIDGYPKIRKSCISLRFLKSSFRVIKDVCNEYAAEFQQYFLDILIRALLVHSKTKVRF